MSILDTYLHGVEVIELNTGSQSIKTVATSVIGVVCTADDADSATFPLNTPVLITNPLAYLEKAGKTGTLKRTLNAIGSIVKTPTVIVRVADSEDSDNALSLPKRGAVLTFAVGYADTPLTNKGEFIVDTVTHEGAPDTLHITAQSADVVGLAKERKERSFHDKTIGEIVKLIATDLKLKPVVSQAFANVKIAHKDQTNEGDLNFLTRLAEEFDAIATVKSERLLFVERGKGLTASGQAIPPFILTRKSGDSHSFTINEGENYKAVKAYWHDKATGKRDFVIYDENSTVTKTKNPTLKKKTKVKRDKAGKPIKGKDGKSVKETVYVQGKGRQVTTIKQSEPITSDSEQIYTLRHEYASKQTAINAVKAKFAKLKRGTASFKLSLAQGEPDLIPEMPVIVQGFKPEIDSTEWLIVRVTNKIDSGTGFTTELEMELKG